MAGVLIFLALFALQHPAQQVYCGVRLPATAVLRAGILGLQVPRDIAHPRRAGRAAGLDRRGGRDCRPGPAGPPGAGQAGRADHA
jgi:hypothetical protein